MKKDKVLRDADRERRDHCREALDSLAEKGLPEWEGFSKPNSNVLLVRGGSGQVHVGDVFRTIFPTLDYLRARNMKIVLASSPRLETAFKGWEDTLKILDASQEPDILVKQFEAEGVLSSVRWVPFFREWRSLLKHSFDEAARPVTRAKQLDVPVEDAMQLRQLYSEGHTKKVLGIIWRTSMIGRDPNRNAQLNDFLPLITRNPKKWNVVSLQYGSLDITEDEVKKFNKKESQHVMFDASVDPMRDYVRSSSQMAACDHIVSIDCSQIFQAGAVGVPVSALLCADPAIDHWQEFMTEGSNVCPFFPDTARIFSQKKMGEWAKPIQKAAEHIKDDLKHHGTWQHPAAQLIKQLG